jgi:hypothetical protein
MIPPGPGFFIFGKSQRRKCVYRAGQLLDPWSGGVIRSWDVAREWIEPAEYRVSLGLKSGQEVVIACDEQGLAITEGGQRAMVSQAPLRLPRFEGHPLAPVLRILHHTILVNIVDGRSEPNLLALRQPSLRHAVLMAMVLRETGNLDLLRPWVLSLRDPFEGTGPHDRNPEHLGQALYLASLVADASHPLVKGALRAIPEFRHNQHVCGITDGALHPVYQTKWLKFGLRALGLDDPYVIPHVYDSYSSQFWMDFRDQHVAGPDLSERLRRMHPYLHWAEAHFHDWPPPAIPAPDTYPITWDTRDPAGNFAAMKILGPQYARRKIAAPHSGHAAEMFLYLLHAGAPASEPAGQECPVADASGSDGLDTGSAQTSGHRG